MHTITTDVQQVITRSQAKNTEWTELDDIRKAAQAWVEKANAANAEQMKQEVVTYTEGEGDLCDK